MPLRLLSRPSTATRSAIGVVPAGTSVTVCGMSIVSGSGSSSLPASCTGAPRGSQAARTSSPASAGFGREIRIFYSGVQA